MPREEKPKPYFGAMKALFQDIARHEAVTQSMSDLLFDSAWYKDSQVIKILTYPNYYKKMIMYPELGEKGR